MNVKKYLWALVFFFLATAVFAVNTDDIVLDFAKNSTGGFRVVGDYSAQPQNFTFGPPSNETWIVSRLIIHIQDNGVLDSGKYGNNINLTKGISIQLVQQNRIYNLTNGNPVFYNNDWGRFNYDLDLVDFGTGDQSINIRWTFSNSGTYIKLDGSKGERLQIVVNDDFTGLTDHTFNFQGYKLQTNEDNMGSLAITLFILLIPIGLYFLAFYVKNFTRHPVSNEAIKGGLLVIATYSMMVAAGVMATIAVNANIPVTGEIFMYLTVFEWIARAGVAIIGLIYLIRVKETAEKVKIAKRMGEYGEEEY